MIHLDTLRALHEHDHKLAAYRATCERWAVLDLDRLIADGRGDYCFVGRNPRCSYCKSPGRQARQAVEIGYAIVCLRRLAQRPRLLEQVGCSPRARRGDLIGRDQAGPE